MDLIALAPEVAAAVAAGAAVVYITQRLALRDARKLAADVADGRLPARVVRWAWDTTREVGLSLAARELLGDTYREGARMNESLDLFRATYAVLSTFDREQLALARQKQLGVSSRAVAREAHRAFERAQEAPSQILQVGSGAERRL